MSMYDLRRRPGIHEDQQLPESNSEQCQTKLRKSKSPFLPKKYDWSNEDTKSNSSSNEDSPKGGKVSKLYPELPKRDFTDIKEKTVKKPEKQHREEKSPESQKNTSPGILSYIILITCVLSLAAAAAATAYFCSIGNTNCETPTCLFQHNYKKLRSNFLNQERLSWKVIMSAVNSVVNKTEHIQPAVILLIADQDAKLTLLCLANHLASSVALSYHNSVDYPRIQNIQPTATKEIIYGTFNKKFGNEKHHVIVLENIDTFPADTAMALHLFCDNENAPYKNIIIILTAIVEDFSPGRTLRLRDMDTLARNHLDKVWKYELDEEKRAALLSRIATNVALIHTENNVSNICHI